MSENQETAFNVVKKLKRALTNKSVELDVDEKFLNDTYLETRIDDIKSNKIDNREYRYLVLKNQMKILLVHDEDVEKSGICNTVSAGNLLDPKGDENGED